MYNKFFAICWNVLRNTISHVYNSSAILFFLTQLYDIPNLLKPFKCLPMYNYLKSTGWGAGGGGPDNSLNNPNTNQRHGSLTNTSAIILQRAITH